MIRSSKHRGIPSFSMDNHIQWNYLDSGPDNFRHLILKTFDAQFKRELALTKTRDILANDTY